MSRVVVNAALRHQSARWGRSFMLDGLGLGSMGVRIGPRGLSEAETHLAE